MPRTPRAGWNAGCSRRSEKAPRHGALTVPGSAALEKRCHFTRSTRRAAFLLDWQLGSVDEEAVISHNHATIGMDRVVVTITPLHVGKDILTWLTLVSCLVNSRLHIGERGLRNTHENAAGYSKRSSSTATHGENEYLPYGKHYATSISRLWLLHVCYVYICAVHDCDEIHEMQASQIQYQTSGEVKSHPPSHSAP